MSIRIFFGLLVLCFLACKKDASTPEVTPPNIRFGPEGLEYINLNMDKYFIYKDSASGELDSVRVSKSILVNIYSPPRSSSGLFDPGSAAFYYDAFTLILVKIDGLTRTEWFHGATVPPFIVLGSTDSASIDMREPDNSPAFFYPLFGSPDNVLISSVTIEGKTYTDVIKHIFDNGLSITEPNYKKVTYYWAKQTGIIKREIVTAKSITTHTLLRSN